MKESDFINVKGITGIFDPVVPDIRQWPIYTISRERKKLMEKVKREVFQSFVEEYSNLSQLRELIAHTYYQERQRLKESPWKVDPKDEASYWKGIRKSLLKLNQHDLPHHEEKSQVEDLLRDIILRYTEEITGDFRIGTFKFAKKATSFGFSRLFHAATEGFSRRLIKSDVNPLLDKIKVTGPLEKIRTLATKGTVILVPTHFSNLDSIIVGWAIEALGLPAFTYGAGINLFGHPVLSYFMHRLGAYTVDRRKKNKVYLQTLKYYTKNVVKYGCHTLFFPGGTRSRSGGIEKKLKLGLLGTVIDAQRELVMEQPQNPKKIFVVPLVLNYHFVLEASNLIDQYLRKEGKEKYYLLKDDFNSLWKNLSFLWKFFSKGSEMMLSFGSPMDLFGNELDDEGNSLDKKGKVMNISGYFEREGKLVTDTQRDNQMTLRLGKIILDKFFQENVVFSSHLVAFEAYRYFRKQEKTMDIYDFLSTPAEDYLIDFKKFEIIITERLDFLFDLQKQGKIRLSDELSLSPDKIITNGVSNLCVYHSQKPLTIIDKKWIGTESLKLLYFYHNKLDGYDFDS